MPSFVAENHELMQYAAAFGLLVLAVLVVAAMLGLSRLVQNRQPNPDKLKTYECGEDPFGSGWMRFNIRFYMVALVFVLFDVELALVFPVAPIFRELTQGPGGFHTGLVVFGELFFFVAVLFLGLVYVWRKGDLGWARTLKLETPPPSDSKQG